MPTKKAKNKAIDNFRETVKKLKPDSAINVGNEIYDALAERNEIPKTKFAPNNVESLSEEIPAYNTTHAVFPDDSLGPWEINSEGATHNCMT